MARKVELVGQRFGRFTVLERSNRTDGHTHWWICKCDCGNTKEVRGGSLLRGDTKSCGCLNREMAKERGKAMLTKHGWYGTRLYSIWHSMVDRCTNSKARNYNDYGGRGITVCEEWRNHPEQFCEWSVKNGYDDSLSIDRIDTNGNYEPANCQWISIEKQQQNKRNNINITLNGETHCLAEWARKLKLKPQTIYSRVYRGITNHEIILFGEKKGEYKYE